MSKRDLTVICSIFILLLAGYFLAGYIVMKELKTLQQSYDKLATTSKSLANVIENLRKEGKVILTDEEKEIVTEILVEPIPPAGMSDKGFVDQQQTVITGTMVTQDIFGNFWYAQSFIPTQSVLVAVEIYGNVVHPPIKVEIRSELFRVPLASGTINEGKKGWILVDFPETPINAGEIYYLVIIPIGKMRVPLVGGAAYPVGETARSTDSGATWTTIPGYDISFKTYSYLKSAK
ncbi:hypothetical protein KAT51_03740 [bacterium]|nr:hypothetical protein [bacterium]